MSLDETEIVKMTFAPGINKNTTELDSEGTYVSCDKVRFFYGKPQKIGGWQKDSVQGTFTGVPRDIHTWTDLEEAKYLGVGTSEKLQIYGGGQIVDITPIRSSVCAVDAFNVTSGESLITLSVFPDGAQSGDYFILAETTASVGGINLAQEYQIVSAGVNHITFNASTSALSSAANFGGTVRVDYLLESGSENNTVAFGWGGGTWNTPGVSVCAGWSEPRGGTGVAVPLRQWTLDNWGEDLLACPEGGKIYRWEASAGLDQRAMLMSSAAPSIVNTMLVAQNGRHVIAFGTHTIDGDYDPLLIRWSDSENFNLWVPQGTNQAGEFRLENGSFIIGAQETRREILVFTDESVYSMVRVGGNSVYSLTDMGKHNGLVSKHAAVDVNGVVYWWAYSTFQSFDGTIRTIPCTVQDALFDPTNDISVNESQQEKVYAGTNRRFNEIWWFYPSKNSKEVDRYIIYNFLENTWYLGTLDRSVWHDSDIFTRPYAISPTGELFIHEQGVNDDASGMKAELLTSMFDLKDGDDLMFIDRHIPDNTITKQLNVEYKYKKYPQDSEEFSKTGYKITPTTKKLHPRIRGRQAQIKYSTSVLGGDFRIGAARLALKPDGGR